MGQSPEELRGEIAQTRQSMSTTLDAIGDHVSPGRIIERRKNRMVQGVQSVRDRVMGSASNASTTISDGTGSAVDTLKDAPEAARQRTQGSPLVAGALAFGAGLLAAAAFPASNAETKAAGQLKEKVEPLKDELINAGKETVENLKEPAAEAVDSVEQTATSGVDEVKATAQDVVDSAKEQGGGAANESPVAAQSPAGWSQAGEGRS